MYESFLAKNIMDRHELLEKTIGTLSEENKSFEMVCFNSWFLPVMVLVVLLMDILLAVGKFYFVILVNHRIIPC